MRLTHLHLQKPIPYSRSLRLQEIVQEKHLAYNRHILHTSKSPSSTTSAKNSSTSDSSSSVPSPTLLTFQTQPVYTVGRRHLNANPLSRAQIDFLTTSNTSGIVEKARNGIDLASFYPSPRGGLLTYHAPGQLTAYLIVNLRAHGITPRCFIRLLENTVIQTCADHGVPNTLTTEDPGVWIGENSEDVRTDGDKSLEVCGGGKGLRPTTRKICAIGVHVTHGITTHGIGLNVFDAAIMPSQISDLYTIPDKESGVHNLAPGYLSWGFGRITACGLEGKSVTWLAKEGAGRNVSLDSVARSLAENACKNLTRLGKIEIDEIESLATEDALTGPDECRTLASQQEVTSAR